jgi:N6-L-threonylcarbamoyladenine synthase
MKNKFILGIETSCDETAASIVDSYGTVLSNVVFTQIDMHKKYGGIVPELASRDHALKIEEVVRTAINDAKIKLDDIGAVGVANGPGLLGCLLIGLSFAKAFAFVKNIPLIGVDHVKAHLLSVTINRVGDIPNFPFIGLVVSGGHTSIYLVRAVDDLLLLSSTVDDAVGEVFDKLARFVGLGYPGGRVLSEMAKKGNPESVKIPVPMIKDRENDFSFSGIKTFVINELRKLGYGPSKDPSYIVDMENQKLLDLVASFQETVCNILVDRLIKAGQEHGVSDLVIGGGVAANYRLRQMLSQKAQSFGLKPWIVPLEYCTDNASMIANYASLLLSLEHFSSEFCFSDSMYKIGAYSTCRR